MSCKAYKVSCRDDDHGMDVVFTDSPNKARRFGNSDNCDCPYIERRAVRAPELDHHAPGPVSLLTLFREHGWWAFCQNCERIVSAEDDAHVVEGETIFCGHACQQKHREYWTQLKAPAAM